MKQAVILAGGVGSRLGSLTTSTAKPLLLVDGKPFLEYLIENLMRYGLDDIILLVGYRGDSFFYLSEPGYFGKCRVRLFFDGDKLLGTGGALRRARGLFEEYFLLLNGDTFFDINLLDLVSTANPRCIVNLALRSVDNVARYNPVTVQSGMIVHFSATGNQGPGLINGGIYFLKREIVDFIPNGNCSLERDVIPKLVEINKVGGRSFNRPFLDIGIPEDFSRAEDFLKRTYFRPAVFFDRDGVLNRDTDYLFQIEKFQWIDGAIEAIKYFNNNGFFVFVVTNQSGVARGLYTENDVQILHHYMNTELRKFGGHIDQFEYCPFHEDGVVGRYKGPSFRRKPQPGMILDLISNWPIRKEDSFLIGDQESDIMAALSANIKGYKFDNGNLFDFIKSHNL